MRRALMTTASFALLALSGHAVAAEAPASADDAQEVTIIATRTEKKVDDVPATVSVINAQTIDDQLVNDIKDLIRYEPGVSVRSSPSRFTAAGSNTGRDGNSGFNIRGLEGNRVLIQVDGIAVPDAFSFGGQSAGRGDYVDLSLLKSVEILRGPASALYGSDGIAGAVSYTTKDPNDFLKNGNSFGGGLKAGYASADDSWNAGFVLAGKTAGNWSGLLAYTRRDGHEQETHGNNNALNVTRTEANPQDISSNAVFGKLVYQPAVGHRLRLTLDHLDSVTDTDALSAVTGVTLDLQAHDTTDRDRVSLDYRYTGAGFIDSAYVAVYGQTSESNQFAAEDRTSTDRTRINIFKTEVYGGKVELISHAETGSLTHNFVYGGDYSTTKQESLRDGTVPPAGETFPTRAFPNTDYTRIGLYIQDEITAFDGKLSLYPAIRYDSYDLKPKADALLTTIVPASQEGSHVSPKISAIYRILQDLSVFANYAEGFKAPSPNEVNNSFANPIANYKSIPNPNLKPETSKSLEAGVRFGHDTWKVDVTAYTSEYKNFITQAMIGGSFSPTDPAIYQYINYSQAEISGLEAKGNVTLNQSFALTLAGSLTTGTKTVNGLESSLETIEPWKLVGGLNYRADTGKFGGQLSVVHSAKKEEARAGITCTGGCYIPGAFTTVDVTAWWNITSSTTLRAGVFNLTDEKYSWWGDVRGLADTSVVKDAYTQPGINGSVSLSYRF
jgi:hemoglobin/transferrin/lactoferrin receptor protein